MSGENMYAAIIEAIFASKHQKGMREVDFEREDIIKVGNKLKIDLPKNTGDLVHNFRYRASLPESIKEHAPKGQMRVIRGRGQAKYRFALVADWPLVPNEVLATTNSSRRDARDCQQIRVQR